MKPTIALILSLSTVTTLLGAFGVMGTRADAFCVYNGTDKKIYFQQSEWKGMATGINARDNSCCNWRNKDCNPSKARGRMLDVAAIRVILKERLTYADSVTCGVETYSAVHGSNIEAKIQAGGYWTIDKNPSFDSKQKYGSDNPPYLVKSWSYDNKVLATYLCPVKRKGKPGLLDFMP
ncbi:MAG: hypothetical protein KME10_25525 [Plectolyngbya sp. WJT66-NPBG17]|jgi:hypothetical protein|nr:hypothetical protein [Plectolyngbya sp. WJT66-NPBG17]MBW4526736.1 hypothetical protein [Phormidium tanganyikae FI6-MK23]